MRNHDVLNESGARRRIVILTAVVVALLAAAAATAQSERANPLPEFDVTSNLALSPSGRYLAASVQVGGFTGVFVYRTDTEDFTLFDSGESRIDWIRWADDDRLLVSLRVLVTRGLTSPSRLAMILPATRRTVSLSDNKHFEMRMSQPTVMQDDVVAILPGNGTRVLLSYPASSSLVRMNLADQRIHYIGGIPSRLDWLFADQTGAPRIGIDWQRRTLERRFASLSSLGITERLFVRAHDDADFEEHYSLPIDETHVFAPVMFDATDRDLLYVVSNHQHQTLGLYEWHTAAREFSPEPVTPLRPGMLRVISNPLRTEIYGVRHISPDNEIAWLEAQHQERVAAIARTLAPAKIDVLSVSDDLGHIAVLASGARDAGTYYLYEASTRSLRQLWADQPDWGDRRVAAVQPVAIDRPGGVTLRGYLSTPAAQARSSSRPRYGVVIVHNGTYARDFFRFDMLVQRLTASGIAVLQIADGRVPRYRRDNNHYVEWSPSNFDDVVAAGQWLKSTQLADASKVCVYGVGYGGYGALMAGVVQPDLFSCIAASNAPSDLNDLDELDFHFFIPRQPPPRLSPLNHADRFSAPVFLAHGQENRQVLPLHSQQLNEALALRGKDVVYMELESEDHEVRDFDTQRRLNEVLLAFVNEHLR